MKVAFDISWILAAIDVGILLYLGSRSYRLRHPQWMAGFDQWILAAAVLAIILVWWVVYFALTKDFKRLPLALLVFVPFVYIGAKNFLSVKQQERTKREWEARVETKTFTSSKLGFSFQYLSDYLYVGPATVVEVGDEIHLITNDGKRIEAIKRLLPESDLPLLEFTETTYAREFPRCQFQSARGDERYFAKESTVSEAVTVWGSTGDEDCPKFFSVPESSDSRRTFLIKLRQEPSKIFAILVSDYPLEAFKHEEQGDPVRWYETLSF
jgi:hypothetical protein